MRKLVIYSAVLLIASSCVSGIEKEAASLEENVDNKTTLDSTSVIDSEQDVTDEKKLSNGITIKWFEHGDGELLIDGSCVNIDYKVQLDDGNVVDGNHLINKPTIPFVVGFGMQTEGWDIALKELKVGDFAEILIPSELARGEKGIKDLIPPNADNIVRIRVLSERKPTRSIDGSKVWVFESNPNMSSEFGESNEIVFHCMASTPTKSFYINTFWDNKPFELRMKDAGLVPGLKKALVGAKRSDRMYVLVPSSEAYGNKGYQDMVKPGEDILYNILVMDVRE